MLKALPLSSASTAARRSAFFSKSSASLTRSFPRFSGVSFLHGPLKALRAAATAMSTSFSVASATLQMTSSVDGLMTSKVLPSTLLTNSLLMKLYHLSVLIRAQRYVRGTAKLPKNLGVCRHDLQAGGLLVLARLGSR